MPLIERVFSNFLADERITPPRLYNFSATTLQWFIGNNIDGIYDDDKRVLIKLVIDLALVSEQIGDEEREYKNNELEAQRNYDRALKLCKLAKNTLNFTRI